MPHNHAMEPDHPDPPPLVGEPQHRVPAHLRERLHPARWVVHEWAEYWLRLDATDVSSIRVGSTHVFDTPNGSGNFRLRFENQLGLSTVEVLHATGGVVDRLHLEVIAPKLGTAEASLEFFQALLAALHQQIAPTPFILSAPTGRQVRDRRATRHPLFDLHFFRTHGATIQAAVQTVIGQPHRRLATEDTLVLPHQVRQVDRAAMVQVLQAARPLPGEMSLQTSPLLRLRPERVLQQIPVETWDTPENRFVLTFAREMLEAITGITRQPWWTTSLGDKDRSDVTSLAEHLMMLTTDRRLADLGPLTVVPAQSRVLQRKDGYRDLWHLWPQFQRVQEPLFATLQRAMDLRQIDQLYELWVLFDLIEQLTAITGERPVLTPRVDAFGVPTNDYAARFGTIGTLFYNRTKATYSGLSLRPDYLWVPAGEGRTWVALDAKFRLSQTWIRQVIDPEAAEDEIAWEPTGQAKATTDDLTKMHAYRDAIPNVRAAVVLFPGTISMFRTTTGSAIPDLTLKMLFEDDGLHGVGAIARSPVGAVQAQIGS
jgi:predicted component of viral defense system (DUF524 family)